MFKGISRVRGTPPARASTSKARDKVSAPSVIDICAKLGVPLLAVVVAAWLAHVFESSATATKLLSEREQAESALRSAMFKDLIDPLVGSTKGADEIPVHRERLLAELLVLNFHENFELKPLLLHVDQRLADGIAHQTNQMPQREGVILERAHEARKSLRSISRGIINRQTAMLIKRDDGRSSGTLTRIVRLRLAQGSSQASGETAESHSGEYCTDKEGETTAVFDQALSIPSPNGSYVLGLTVEDPDWGNQSFRVLATIWDGHDQPGASESASISQRMAELVTSWVGISQAAPMKSTLEAQHGFLLTWFDFPFTDNTLLADGTRFSVVLDEVCPSQRIAKLRVIWFPRDYFSARERPVNYTQFREKLGLQLPK